MANNEDYYYDDLNSYSLCPKWAPVLGFGGIVAAVVFASKSATLKLRSRLWRTNGLLE
jgi:hypothetical protein